MNNGSDTGNVALAILATGLNMSIPVLRNFLEEAFEITQQNINPRLAFQMALNRVGYDIDGQILHAKLDRFHSMFASAFGITQGRDWFDDDTSHLLIIPSIVIPRNPTLQMRPNPYRALGNESRDPNTPQAQYTVAAMAWHSCYSAPQSSSEHQFILNRCTAGNSVSQSSSPQHGC
jgi:hypothetical protein